MTKRNQFRRAALLAAAITVAGATVATRAQVPERSVWTGVFTPDQATRGKTAYDQYCAACHSPTLSGGDSAPALTGGPFLNNWNSTPATDLYDRIKTTMPAGDPGSLNAKTVTDIEAYIFQVNGFPAGSVELPPSPQMQAGVKIVATRPAG